ncbi:hypothetical protein AAF712_000838 [Marasmius tenuissimus]|uniref:F-box domain-containing protein n=1 Tax=Marasmius tenuissimus TaxID=585030 RepID=A0ABR3AEE5_9AGAR
MSESQSTDRDFPLISILPNEILLQIFSSGIEDEIDDMVDWSSRYSIHPPLGFPLAVSGVCRSWRALALSSPTLWTTVVACSEYQFYGQLFLERSYPLQISLLVIDRFRAAEAAAMTIPHFSRARSLSIRPYSGAEAFSYSKAFSELSAPCLEEFSVVLQSRSALPGQYDGLKFIRDTSELRSVTVKGIPFPFDHSSSWQNLTFLNVRGFCPTYTQFSQLLQSAPLLETLYLPTFRWSPDLAVNVGRAPKIEAPALKNLCLGLGDGHDDTRCECPISLLIMGNLRSLTVVGDKHSIISRLAHHFSGEHAENEFSQLTTVKLVGLELVSRDATFFRRLQNVRRLEVESVGGDFLSNLVQRYQVNSEFLIPLPLLETIAFHSLDEAHIQWLDKRSAAQTTQLTVELPGSQEEITSTKTSFEWRISEMDWLKFPLDRGDPGDDGWYDDEEVDDWDLEEDFAYDIWDIDTYAGYDHEEDFEDYDYDDDGPYTFADIVGYEDSVDFASDFW